MLTRTVGAVEPISLAHVPPFRLGDLDVHPATRQIVRNGRSETLEPRVMQVLVALAQAGGAVVTRDELTDLCWDGRIVSENAINRVISRLRQIAAEFGAGSFQLETITKVGYRLVAIDPALTFEAALPDCSADTERDARTEAAPPSRRTVVGAISVAALMAAGGGAYWLTQAPTGTTSSRSALQLYQKGVEARAQGLANMVGQAEAFFAQAVEADPKFAEAWAALALARAGQVPWEQGEAQETMAARARFAADRALQIDPGSVEAQTALAFLPSTFGRWAEAQADCRRLLEAPGKTTHVEWLLRARLSHSLGEVGRCRDALQEFRPVARIYPDHPYSSTGLIQALWCAGYADEARAESDRALIRFPRHADVWFARMVLLTFGSNPEAAVAFAADRAQLPFRESGEGLIFRRILSARALAYLKPAEIEHAVSLHGAAVAADRQEIPAAARFFAALGRIDTVIELLRGYYFNEGEFADPARLPAGPFTRYAVFDLFWPPMAPVWADPRFETLVQGIGLAAYWRQTGTVPDYKRRTG